MGVTVFTWLLLVSKSLKTQDTVYMHNNNCDIITYVYCIYMPLYDTYHFNAILFLVAGSDEILIDNSRLQQCPVVGLVLEQNGLIPVLNLTLVPILLHQRRVEQQ